MTKTAPPDAPAVQPDNAPKSRVTVTGKPRRSRRAEGGAPTLATDDLVAGRYRILQFIAAGGMGEVYAAHDQELDSRIALKTLPTDLLGPGSMGSKTVIERFRNEIQLARKVTHPNVCRIFDLGYHTLASGQLAFLTMELVEGPTLSQRIRQGPLGLEEARRIGQQMAAALGAAHEAGVIHRDFKSSNVLLRAAVDESRGLRAVVTDFGLALPEDEGHSDGEFVLGTPEYMAPEQLTGRPLTAACDLYALGVVMFEMVTGQLPFPSENPYARVDGPPPSPRTLAPDLPEQWEAVILRCLQRAPEDRFASAAEVAAALQHGAPPSRPVRRRRRVALLTLGGAVAAAAAIAVLLHRSATPILNSDPASVEPAAQKSVKRRRTVAVLGFKNLSGRADAAWISTALEEMLSTELGAGADLRVIPPDNVARMKLEMGMRAGDALSASVLQRVRSHIDADLVVDGSYLALDASGRLRVDVRLQETNAGETLLAVNETGAQTELFELVTRAGGRLRERLGTGKVAEHDVVGVRAAIPTNPEAARLYSEGLARLRQLDPLTARELLEKAAAKEPAHPFVHSALSSAWSALGYDEKAREEARRAFDLSSRLSRADRLTIEGRLRETQPDWEQAIRIYRALCSFFPDDLDYGLRLAAVETAAGHGKDALNTVASLRELPAPAGDDPGIDMAEAQAADSLSDFKRERTAAAAAARKGNARGAHLLIARARLAEGAASWGLGDPKGALTAYEDALRIATAAGDRVDRARALQQIASVRIQQGDAGAKKLFEDALAIYREIGDRRGEAGALSGIATIVTEENPDEAIRLYQLALAADRATGDKRRIAVELNNLGTTYEQQRKLSLAGQNYEEAARVLRQAGFDSAAGSASSNLAMILLNRGDVDGARETVQEALQILKPTGSQPDISWAQSVLAQVLRAQDDAAGARRRLDQAVEICQKLDQPGDVAANQVLLAILALEANQPAEAERIARQAAATAATARSPTNEAWAWHTVAEALLAAAKPADAAEAIAHARKLQPPSVDPDHALFLAVATARVQAASGAKKAATDALRAELARARHDGYVYHQLVIRLALAELHDGESAAHLAEDARSRGFLRLSRRALALTHR